MNVVGELLERVSGRISREDLEKLRICIKDEMMKSATMHHARMVLLEEQEEEVLAALKRLEEAPRRGRPRKLQAVGSAPLEDVEEVLSE